VTDAEEMAFRSRVLLPCRARMGAISSDSDLFNFHCPLKLQSVLCGGAAMLVLGWRKFSYPNKRYSR
jgi:hypothetical protein